MTKYWALIISFRPHIYSLGKHENADEAEGMAKEFCDRKNKEQTESWEKAKQENPTSEITEPYPFQLAYILDESDLRSLTGEVHRPFVIAKAKKEVAVEAPTRRGGSNDCQCGSSQCNAGSEAETNEESET